MGARVVLMVVFCIFFAAGGESSVAATLQLRSIPGRATAAAVSATPIFIRNAKKFVGIITESWITARPPPAASFPDVMHLRPYPFQCSLALRFRACSLQHARRADNAFMWAHARQSASSAGYIVRMLQSFLGARLGEAGRRHPTFVRRPPFLQSMGAGRAGLDCLATSLST